MANVDIITPEDLAAFDLHAQASLAAVPTQELVLGEGGPLTAEILAEGPPAAIQPGQEALVTFESIRARHHRVAQMLAAGLKPTTIARIVGFTPGFVANLQRSPAFQELLAHYTAEVHDQFTDFVQAAAEFSAEVLDELRDRLQENPKQFTVNQLLESMKATADRSGNAPVAKSVSVSVTADLGAKLAEARRRATAAMLPPPSEEVPGG